MMMMMMIVDDVVIITTSIVSSITGRLHGSRLAKQLIGHKQRSDRNLFTVDTDKHKRSS